MSESKKHINNEVTKLVEELKGRTCQAYMETGSLQDFLEDGGTVQEYEDHVRDYAIFVVQPYFGHIDGEVTKVLKELCGDDIDVKYYSGCYEFEVQRIPEHERVPKLKACPFCGFSAAQVTLIGDLSEIHCQCSARGPVLGSEKLAVEAWNSRASE